MKLSRLGEFGLIDRIRARAAGGRGVRIGIGDDAAWVDHPAGSSLITADLLIEEVHFDLSWISLFELGYKSLAVNLSDIAAMGGAPAYALLSLGIPGSFDSKQIEELYRGVNALARQTGVALVGGDTNIAPSLIVSVCVIGHPPEQPVFRSGAGVGDDIYVTGTLGDSGLGMSFLKRGMKRTQNRLIKHLILRHHRPTPRIAAGALLARRRLATAMIDISDGLLQDLGHICQASGVGAVIWNDRLPLSLAYRALAGSEKTAFALSGGEDYELLFCARPKDRSRIDKLAKPAGVRITRIGACVPGRRGVKVLDSSGKAISTRFEGHDHFKAPVRI
ncbi:MAG TPA: thiamine-phosphate kinase [Candidatus Binatia bacterium]|nr:thiamine-phosphate kinase [Candidatus Binatia bacterium]